jgi:hypothetical protein
MSEPQVSGSGASTARSGLDEIVVVVDGCAVQTLSDGIGTTLDALRQSRHPLVQSFEAKVELHSVPWVSRYMHIAQFRLWG